MADRSLLRPRLSRKTAGANFMSPAKDWDPDPLRLRGPAMTSRTVIEAELRATVAEAVASFAWSLR
jgi:hypothetical protein